MKFQADKDLLSESVNFAVRLLPQRASLPILSGILISAANNKISFSVFDYEVSAKSEMDASVESEGTVLVVGRLLAEILSKLPNQTVSIELVDNKVLISCGASKFTLLTMPTAEYPELPEIPTSNGVVDGQLFAEAVSQVATAASKEDVTPVLTGVQITVSKTSLSMVATDRFRVAFREIPWSSDTEESVLVPARTVQEVSKIFANQGNLNIAIQKNEDREMVAFTANNKSVTSVLLKGNFPAVLSLFPDTDESFSVVNAHDLGDSTKRVGLVVDRDRPLRYIFESKSVTLESFGSETAQATESLDAELVGDETKLSLKPQFLLDGLSGVTTEYAKIVFTKNANNPGKPGPVLITNQNPKGEVQNYKYLLQPNLLEG